jgi:sugar phosphate permease
MGVMDGMNGGVISSVSQVFAGPQAVGRWVGVQNAIGNVAGMVAPVVTGYLVQALGITQSLCSSRAARLW